METITYKNKIQLDVLEENSGIYLLKVTKTKLNKLDPELRIICGLKAFYNGEEYFSKTVITVQDALDIMTKKNKEKKSLKWAFFLHKNEL